MEVRPSRVGGGGGSNSLSLQFVHIPTAKINNIRFRCVNKNSVPMRNYIDSTKAQPNGPLPTKILESIQVGMQWAFSLNCSKNAITTVLYSSL